MKTLTPKWLQRFVLSWAKSYHPRYTEANVGSQGWGSAFDESQDLSANVKAIKSVIWAYICIRKINRTVAGLPMKFYRGYDDRKRQIFKGDIIDLIRRPNTNDTHRELWLDTCGYLLGTGNAYWGLDGVSQATGKPVAGKTNIWTLPAHKVAIIPSKNDPANRVSHYNLLTDSGEKVRYENNEIVHFKDFNLDNQWYGLAPLTVAMQLMESDYSARKHNRNFFRNGATTGLHLKSDQPYNEEAEKQILNSTRQYQGSDNNHKAFISWAGLEKQPEDKSPKDLDFINLIKLNREEIIALFGGYPAVFGLFEYANYANAEMQKREFWLETIIPMLRHFETRLNELVFPGWTDKEIWFEFDLSKVPALKDDLLLKAKVSSILNNSGIMTANEIRAEHWNLEPIEGGDELKKPASPFSVPPEKRIQFKTYDKLTELWWQKDINRRKHEFKFFDEMKSYFAGQKNRMLKTLSAYSDDYQITDDDVNYIYNHLLEQNYLEDQTTGLYKIAIEDSGQLAIDEVRPKKSFKQPEIEIVPMFDITDPVVSAWIESKVAMFVTHVDDATINYIRLLLKKGYEEGWSLKTLADEMGSMFDGFSKTRSLTIAQTEMGSATNAGTMQGYRQSNVVDKKIWLSSRDQDVRDSHRMAEEQGEIDLEAKFHNGLDHPGDPAGAAGEIINCRCDILAVVKEN